MRTAEEVLKEFENKVFDKNEYPKGYPYISEAMKQYAKEAIEEAAERATFNQTLYDAYNHTQVDKESILSLINELK